MRRTGTTGARPRLLGGASWSNKLTGSGSYPLALAAELALALPGKLVSSTASSPGASAGYCTDTVSAAGMAGMHVTIRTRSTSMFARTWDHFARML